MAKSCNHPTCGSSCRRPPAKSKPWSQYDRRRRMLGTAEAGGKELDHADLLAIAQKQFNLYIRLRDQNLGCISCESQRTEQAGHYYPAGKFSGVRFDEVNTNGQCRMCNEGQEGSMDAYYVGLVARYGAEAVKALEDRATATKLHKWDRSELQELIVNLKAKIKALNQKK